ncbi:MAG TPA: serine/threonine-protein kinase, partial [Planctomycetota bacterium]|nr:serine/threonine-protein kinase [Planctomycetota bacterium]
VALSALSVAVAVAAVLARYLSRQQRLTRAANAAAESAERRLQAMGSYTLLHQLGSGGMGTVWKAEHQMLARPAALKLINFATLGYGDGERAQAQERFEREAKATARLRSRNTVTLYDYGVAADGSFYYAMELLDGLDLDRLVTEFGAQGAGRVVPILIQICNSLAEAHAQGLVHRDIKPANIYLCRLGTEVDVVKVLDFGLVTERTRPDARASGPGVVRGTPAFMAPEQAQSRAIDGRTDLYAVGCVAYWLLTGRTVFDDNDPMAAMVDHITLAPTPIASRVPSLPDGLATIVMTLLAKDPAQRPADAGAVIDALHAVRLPADQAWRPDAANAWWAKHRPVSAKPDTDDLVVPTVHRTVMPVSISVGVSGGAGAELI